jgi:small subunit ribosomal protein S6
MSSYELVFITVPELDEEGLTAFVQKLTALVQGLGGQVAQMESRGKRQLAYPIRKYREGYYYVAQLQIGADALKELERSLKLNEQLMRYMIVRKDSKA